MSEISPRDRKLVSKLSDSLVEQDRRLRDLERAPQLGYSALHGSLPIFGDDDKLKAIVGRQPDGTFTSKSVDGPVPAAPSQLSVAAGEGAADVSWDGLTSSGGVPPADFKTLRVEAHLVGDESRGWESKGSMPSPEGGNTVVSLHSGDWLIRGRIVSESGQVSDPSAESTVTIAPPVDVEAIEADLEDARQRIADAQEYADGKFQEYDTGMAEHATNITAAQSDIDDAHDRIDVTDATAEAAKAAAQDAQSDADTAIADLLTLSNVTDGKANFYAQISEPTGSRRKAGNLWLRTTDYKLHYYDAATDTWVESTDQVATQAAADAAQAVADAASLQSKYDLLVLSMDGEGGLKDRLGKAENTLENAAAKSELSELDDKLSTLSDSAENKLRNHSFEYGDEAWSLPSTATIIESGGAYHGESVLQIRSTGGIVSVDYDGGFLPTQTGDVWELSARFKRVDESTSGYAYLMFQMESEDGTVSTYTAARIGSTGVAELPWSDQWQKLTGVYTMPADVVGVRALIRTHGSMGSGGVVHVDTVSLKDMSSIFVESILNAVWSELGVFGRLQAEDGWIGGSAFENGVITTKVLEAAQEIITGLFAAEYGLIEEELVVKNNFITKNITAINAALQTLSVTEMANFVSAFADELYADEFTARSAVLARAIVAAPNMLPSPQENIDTPADQRFFGPGFGTSAINGFWVQGRLTSYTQGTLRFEEGEQYHLTVDVAGSIPGTRYYMDFIKPDQSTYFRVASSLEAGTTSNWANLDVTFEAPDTDDYEIRIWANHSSGAANPDGYQWFNNFRIKHMLDGRLLVDGTVTTRHLEVTETMVGKFAELLHLVVDQIDANSLWADQAWLTAVETAGVRLRTVIDSWETLLSGHGMEVITPEGQPSVQLGNYEETGLTLYQDGEATASMTDDGAMSGKVISANEAFFYQGTELSEIIPTEDDIPGGLVAHHMRYVGGFHEQQVEERGFVEISFPVYPGRSYLISTNPMTVHSPTSSRIYLQLRHRNNASTTLDSQLLARGATETNTSDVGQVQVSTIYHHPVDEEETNKYVIASFSSAAPWMVSSGTGGLGDLHLYALDLGPTISNGHDRNLGKGRFDSGADPAPTPPPATTPKVRRVKTYGMSWWRTWWANGNIPSSGVGVKEAAQGRSPYVTAAGIYKSMIGFPSMTSDLSGADIEKIEVRVRVIHSHAGSGGNVRLGTHSNTSRPSGYTGFSNTQATNTHFGRGQEKWITLPSSLHAGFKNGTYRGVTMATTSTSSTYYVHAAPSRFSIRVTYRK